VSLCIGEAIANAVNLGVDKLDAEVLLYTALNKVRTYLMAFPEQILTAEQSENYSNWISRRLDGEPVAYIVGVREFWSLPIKTTNVTLIPRADTEVLVETVLDQFDASPLAVVDLGTGTGAIALALKSERPSWQMLGVDRISEAIELARTNAASLRLDVSFEVSSWCDALADSSLDVIVSNPPYIDCKDHHLNEGDVRFEPKSALVSGEHGLADIKHISHEAVRCLKPNGMVFFEHGWTQAEAVQQILTDVGFIQVRTVKDYGDNDRVTMGVLP
jgi:release factor glutamine methyltransferase